jgi:hypothetical protein
MPGSLNQPNKEHQVTPKEVMAEIFARVVDKPGHNMLASEVVKKLDAAGYVILPKELTPAVACALERAAPPEAQSKEAVAQLVEDYREMWSHVIASA